MKRNKVGELRVVNNHKLPASQRDKYALSRWHRLVPNSKYDEAGLFVEDVNIMEMEHLLQILPINGLDKRVMRKQIKWLVKVCEKELGIILDSPYDTSGKREKYLGDKPR